MGSIGRAIPGAEIYVIKAGRRRSPAPASRASSCTAARWSAWGTGASPTLTAREDPPLPRARAPDRRRARRLERRHRPGRRGRRPLVRRPHRRHDQDQRLPPQPGRGRGPGLPQRRSSVTPSPSASTTTSSARSSTSPSRRSPGFDAGGAARALPAGHAPLHGPAPVPRLARCHAAHRERQARAARRHPQLRRRALAAKRPAYSTQ